FRGGLAQGRLGALHLHPREPDRLARVAADDPGQLLGALRQQRGGAVEHGGARRAREPAGGHRRGGAVDRRGDGRGIRLGRRPHPFFAAACAGAITHSSSNITFAPLTAVIPDGSCGGEISTTSAPTASMPPSERMITWRSRIETPPGSGTAVAGASRGSRPSMSTVM